MSNTKKSYKKPKNISIQAIAKTIQTIVTTHFKNTGIFTFHGHSYSILFAFYCEMRITIRFLQSKSM
jgi:hypothetical protein